MSKSEDPPVGNFECDEVTIVAGGQTVYQWKRSAGEKTLPFQAVPRMRVKQRPNSPGGPIGVLITDDPDDPPPG
jgi:hypothetical protein